MLTEEEGALITKGAKEEKAANAKAIKKAGKLSVSDAIDKATVYGDVRVRYEDRQGNGENATSAVDTNQTRDRARYKITAGVKTESGDWYSDLAFAMGANGRSDNATFGKTTGSLNDKETLYVKRAMVGYKATDWLTVEAGRMDNPLYTTSMVWDADLTVEGLSEKAKYKLNDQTELFGLAGQWQYKGDRSLIDPLNSTSAVSTVTSELLAFQGGVKYAFNDRTSAKVAMTYSTITHNAGNGKFFTPGITNKALTASPGTNDLDTIEIPAEINYMATPSVGVRLFGDYVYNTSANDRYNHAIAQAGTDAATVRAAGNDDVAWLLGVAVGSAKDLKAFEGNKMVAGDWSARLWYQDVGVYSVDQNAVDSDINDSRVNMKGTAFKAQYNVQDNVLLNFTAAHADRKNDLLAAAAGSGNDTTLNLKSFDLFQFDVTYKF